MTKYWDGPIPLDQQYVLRTWELKASVSRIQVVQWGGCPGSNCGAWTSQYSPFLTTSLKEDIKMGERLSTSNLIVHKGCIIRWKPNYLENLDHFKSWLYEAESDFANKTSLTSLSEMKKFCWWLKEDMLMGTYCVLIVLIPWPLMTICLTPNDIHDTQSAYMGEYMRGLGI